MDLKLMQVKLDLPSSINISQAKLLRKATVVYNQLLKDKYHHLLRHLVEKKKDMDVVCLAKSQQEGIDAVTFGVRAQEQLNQLLRYYQDILNDMQEDYQNKLNKMKERCKTSTVT